MNERLMEQMEFIKTADKMKTVYRRTQVMDKSRSETDAEHSWHLALMAHILREYAPEDCDIDHVVKLVLGHDLVEIYAGDTFLYDKEGNATKRERELKAADKVYAILPREQGAYWRGLWEEFEENETLEANFANALDRLQPLWNNYNTEGHTWRRGEITADMVLANAEKIKKGAPRLYELAEAIIADSVKRGWLREKRTE